MRNICYQGRVRIFKTPKWKYWPVGHTLQQGPRGKHSSCQTLTPKLLHDRLEVGGGSVRALEDIYLSSGCKNSLLLDSSTKDWTQGQFLKTFYFIYYGWIGDSMYMFYSVHAKIRGQPCGVRFLLTPLMGPRDWTQVLSLAPSQYFNYNKAIPCLCWLLAECKLCLLHYDPTHTCAYTNKDKKHNWSWSCRGLLPSLHSGLQDLLFCL